MGFRIETKRRDRIRTRGLIPNRFYESAINKQIAIRELGWGAFNDFTDRLWNMESSKREKEIKEATVELGSLIRGERVGSNSPGNSEIPGALDGQITKTLIYG